MKTQWSFATMFTRLVAWTAICCSPWCLLAAQQESVPTQEQPAANQDMSVDLIDNFDGNFEIEWEVLRPDAEMVSLETNPGCLTLTTQRGSINGDSDADPLSEGILPKNFYLVPNQLDESVDFQIEVKVSDFHPSGYYHQAGIILFNDDDNYLKLGFEYFRGNTSGLSVTFGMEVEQKSTFQWKDPGETSELVLRLVRRDGVFFGYAGKSAEDLELFYENQEWKVDSGPAKVGFYAKNGGNPAADQIEVQFDYFKFTSEIDE